MPKTIIEFELQRINTPQNIKNGPHTHLKPLLDLRKGLAMLTMVHQIFTMNLDAKNIN
jgi:hypothetical protein